MKLTFVFLQAIAAFEPTDVILGYHDLLRPRQVLVQPGDNVLLIEAWDKEALSDGILPRILERFRIPEHWQGYHVLEWLPNTTLQVIQFADFRKAVGADTDADFMTSLQMLFKQKFRTKKTKKLKRSFLHLLEDAFGKVCMDDPFVSAPLERKLRSVLAFFASDNERLAWLVRHVLIDGYVSGDEVCLTGEGDSFQLRLHMWHRFEENFGTQLVSEIHEHGKNVFSSVQIAGELQHYIFRRGGKKLVQSKLQPYIRTSDAIIGIDNEIDVVWVDQTEMEGDIVVMAKGTNYVFPNRWVHGVLQPPRGGAMTLELRISVGDDVACNDMHIRVVQLQDSGNTSEQMESAFQENLTSIREYVAHYFEANLPHEEFGMRLALLLNRGGQEL